jgi:probable rRNA maturation factor
VLDLEILGSPPESGVPPAEEVRRLCAMALASAGVEDGHLAIEFVDEQRMAELNREHRGRQGSTDVLSFPIDGDAPSGDAGGPPRELGDVIICPQLAVDLREAIVHGTLHLAGMDHETDEGEMLAVQRELLAWSHGRLEGDRCGQDAGPDAPRR